MTARLGQVLYWTGCGIAALLIAAGTAASFFDADDGMARLGPLLISGVIALAFWLIGRAALYVLAAR